MADCLSGKDDFGNMLHKTDFLSSMTGTGSEQVKLM
jgi:hypothetical protein